jgi:LysM repeat protein
MFYRQPPPRIPLSCPFGSSQYTVRPGDTFYKIAQQFAVGVQNLIAANSHIQNPNILYVNDVLCIPPAPLASPCAMILQPRMDIASPIQMSGVGFIHTGPNGESSLSVVATLPAPSEVNLQRYDVYLLSNPPQGVSKQLMGVPNNPNLWAARIDDIAPYNITRSSVLFISGSSMESVAPPPGDRVLLEGRLINCR